MSPPAFNWTDVSAQVPDTDVTWAQHVMIYGDHMIECFVSFTDQSKIHVRAVRNPAGGPPIVVANTSFAHNLTVIEGGLAFVGMYRIDTTRFILLWSGNGASGPTASPLRARLVVWDGTAFTVGAQLDNIATAPDTHHPVFVENAVKMDDERIFICYQRHFTATGGVNYPLALYGQVLGVTATTTLSVLAGETLLYTPPSGGLIMFTSGTSADLESDYPGWYHHGDLVFTGAYELAPNSGRQMTLHINPTTSAITVVTEEAMTTAAIAMMVPIGSGHYLGFIDTANATEPLDDLTFQIYTHDGTRLVAVGSPATWSTPTNSYTSQGESVPIAWDGGWGLMVQTYSNDGVDFTNQRLMWFQLSIDASWNVTLTVTDITGQAKDSLGNPASVADAAGYLVWPDGRGMVFSDWADAPDYANDTAAAWYAQGGVFAMPTPNFIATPGALSAQFYPYGPTGVTGAGRNRPR